MKIIELLNEFLTGEQLNQANEEEQMAAIAKNWFEIKNIKNPSEAVQMFAVNKNGYMIKYIKNPSEDIQLAAVNQEGSIIRDIKNPSEAVQMAAVQKDGLALKYIKNPANKQIVLTAILKLYKEGTEQLLGDEEDIEYSDEYYNKGYDNLIGQFYKLYKKYRKKYPDWPEWDSIYKSLKTDKFPGLKS